MTADRTHKPVSMPVSDQVARTIRQVAETIASADALLITAGAGMSADSGLPVFRGNEGFWRAYPPLAAQRISFERMAQPVWFTDRPRMAWAFYGHRLQLYRDTPPHEGYAILRRWSEHKPAGAFVVTSNVDGHFRIAGFPEDAVTEQHGSIHRLQCLRPCVQETWDTPATDLDIDIESLEARGELPVCPHCGALARPNILMFNDADWVETITREQQRAQQRWMASVRGKRVVVLETGAGTAIPTIRRIGERAAERPRTTLVRINPEPRQADESGIVLPLPALQALTLLDEAMAGSRRGGSGTKQQRPSPDSAGGADHGFHTLPAREMPVIDLPPTSAMRTRSAFRGKAAPGKAGLQSVNYIDLRRGYFATIETHYISREEIEYCMAHWRGEAQRTFVPMPVLRGLELAGFTMRGQVVRPAEDPAHLTPGAALLQIRDPRDTLIVSTAFSRRSREGAYIWRRLIEGAKTPVQPMDYPREPWIVRLLEPAAGRSSAMLATLAFVEYAIAVAWLTTQEERERDE